MFQHNCVPRNKCRSDSINSSHKWIIPRCNNKYKSMWDSFNHPPEIIAIFDFNRSQSVNCDICHIAGTFIKSAKLAAIANRSPHLPCYFWNNFLVHCTNCRYACLYQFNTFFDWAHIPFSLCNFCTCHSSISLTSR